MYTKKWRFDFKRKVIGLVYAVECNKQPTRDQKDMDKAGLTRVADVTAATGPALGDQNIFVL